jgi:serine/threonine-protein kinase
MKECPSCRRCFPDELNNCPQDGAEIIPSLHGEPVLDARYQLERRLGQGGMGVVFQARHIFLKTAHAIKVILPDLVGNDPMLVTRFRQEALAAAAIRHQNIIAVTDFGVVRGTMPFLVMEFVNGRSLQEIMAEEKIMPPARALEFVSALGAGVAAAHRQNIVHRDLKPLNIMAQNNVPVSEGLKILDFGLAKIKSGELLGSFVQAKTSGLMGSPFYMAPEQWSDEEPDARADVYSLGIILYQMLAGDVPFKGSSIPSIMKKHLTLPPPSFQSQGIQVQPAIESVVRHALEKEPDARIASVEDFLRDLRAAVNSSGGHVVVTPARKTGNLDPNKTVIAPFSGDTNVAIGEVSQSDSHFGSMAGTVSSAALEENAQKEIEEARRIEQERRERAAREELERESEERRRAEEAQRKQKEEEARLQKEREERERQQRDQMDRVERQARELEEKLARLATSMPPPHQVGVIDPEATHVHQAVLTRPVGHGTVPATVPVPEQPPVAPTSSRNLVLIGIGTLVVVLIAAVVLGYFLSRAKPTPVTQTTTTETPGGPPTIVSSFQSDLIEIPGGTFKMGRDDGPLQERPSHSVSVQTFYMDRSEVTNAEYLEFVRDTGHTAPPYWPNGKPIFGQELWPVVYVSVEDAKSFATWRSKRDNADYRLPTEEEWEYAARGGDRELLYPWGSQWVDGRAVVKQEFPKAVGSMKDGKNIWGVNDLIGNVWEWTSTPIELYEGNKEAQFSSEYKGWIIKRGGSFLSDPHDKNNPITSTYRDFAPPSTKHPTIGFRLVRAAL